MEISKVHAVFFSPTGNAKKVICTVADAVGAALGVPVAYDDFTLPQARQETRSYGPGDLVVFGTPTYAGRIPNKLLPFVQSGFQGNGALAVPVAVFGNRSYDNALMELRNELEAHGFHTVAGAGVPTEHVFSDKLAPGRPNADDLAELADAIAANAQVAVRQSKAAVRRGLQADMATGVAYESEAFGLCFATEDQKDAMAAFLKKEKLPGFKNK